MGRNFGCEVYLLGGTIFMKTLLVSSAFLLFALISCASSNKAPSESSSREGNRQSQVAIKSGLMAIKVQALGME